VSDQTADSQPFRRTPDAAAAAIAAAQGGAISLAQLRGCGLSEGAVRWRVRSGRLHRKHHGVYALGHAEVTPRGRLWAAVLAGGGPEHAALSHVTAAALWDLVPWPSGRIDVTTRTERSSTRKLRFHESRTLSLDDIHYDRDDGLPYTTLERTRIDLADVLTPYRLKRVCHRIEHLYGNDAQRPRPGRRTRKVDTALATLKIAPPQITRNALEERFLALAARAGLPPPLVNTERGPYCADFLWPELHLIVETDGVRTHNTDTAFHADRRRDIDLKVAGYQTLRFTWDHVVNDPAWVERALRAITTTPSPPPP
jgi:hypothetical protein